MFQVRWAGCESHIQLVTGWKWAMCGPGPARCETCLSVVKQMFVQQLVSSGVRPCQQLGPSSWQCLCNHRQHRSTLAPGLVSVEWPQPAKKQKQNIRPAFVCWLVWLILTMSPWVLPERTLGTVRYTETYPGNYLICRTVPCLLSTVPWLSLFRPLLMSQYLKYTCTDRQASYLYKVGLEYETVKPRRNFNLYTLMRAILLQISRWSGMRVSKLGTVWSRLGTVRHIR